MLRTKIQTKIFCPILLTLLIIIGLKLFFISQKSIPRKNCLSLEQALDGYIAKYGVEDFLTQYYNLLGTLPYADINIKNYDIAGLLGINIDEQLPIRVTKDEIYEMLTKKRLMSDRLKLARYFSTPNKFFRLTKAQRLFLKWHFSAPRNYKSNIEEIKNSYVLGWNEHINIIGNKDFDLYTFGIIGCTAIIAVLQDGSIQVSHFDGAVNKEQLKQLYHFTNKELLPKIFIIGLSARKVAEAVLVKIPKVFVHEKKLINWRTESYAVRVYRKDGCLKIKNSCSRISEKYISSIHNRDYGKWFSYGDFSQIYASGICYFQETPFSKISNN
ncbi:MAG: hypothetical protein AABY49_07460 [Planctomycetota bacterium]